MVGAVSNVDGTMLDTWRACGADRLDPICFHTIAALLRQAASHTGETRRLLDARLSELMAAYAARVSRATHASDAAGGAAAVSEPARSALAELLAHIASQVRADGSVVGDLGRHAGAAPELKLLEDFRETWSRFSAEKQLRQSLDQVPTNAGPLNSSSLVHRSLLLMRELSPEYLRQFLSYVDALSWLEQMRADGAAASHDAARAGGGRKSARSRSR